MAGWRPPGLHSSSATPPLTSDTRSVAPRSRTAAPPTRTPRAEVAPSGGGRARPGRGRRRGPRTAGPDSGAPATARPAQDGRRSAPARARLAELGPGLEERRALDGAGPVVFEKDQGRPGDRLGRRVVLD